MSTNFEDTKWYSYTSTTQTTRTWAKHIKSFEEVPRGFQSAFPKYNTDFPYALFLPENRFSLFQKRNQQIICLFEDHFVLLEDARNEIKTFSSSFADVLHLERGKVLLSSWLKIVTLSGTVSIRFNTTNERLFQPVIDGIRWGMKLTRPVEEQPDKLELARFKYLELLNFKYMNYGRKSIYPNDPIQTIVYQPERTIRQFNLFNKTLFRQYATDHLTILTESELILIKEEKRIKASKLNSYGGVFFYIPRRNTQKVIFTPNPEGSICTMEVVLPEDNRLTSEFSMDNEELDKLRRFLKK